MRAPAFWMRGTPGAQARLLQPLGALYGAVAARRLRAPGARARIPVLCVGNFVAGGAGKTPAAIALAAMLRDVGHAPAFLSRGYGGALSGAAPVRVDPRLHRAAEVGDEPLLLSRHAPAFICVDRVAGAEAAAQAGATVVVMDDGLQNPALRKDLAIAIVDGATGIGNGLCLPAGPLRAPLAAQWPLVDAVALVGAGAAGERVAAAAGAAGRPALRARLAPVNGARFERRRVFAFSGIGRPEKFFETLRATGAAIVGARAFGDHHAFSAAELAEIRDAARAKDAELIVTTEKDSARIAPGALPGLETLAVEMQFEDSAAVRALLARLSRG